MLSEIIPQKLYVSDEHSACHYQWLDQLNIKSLLRLDKDAIYRKSWDEQGQRTLGTVHLIDGGVGNSVESYLLAIDFIKTRILYNQTPVLVYCMAGQSRSPCICALFLYSAGLCKTFDEAMQYMRSKHAFTSTKEEIIEFVKQYVIPQIKVSSEPI